MFHTEQMRQQQRLVYSFMLQKETKTRGFRKPTTCTLLVILRHSMQLATCNEITTVTSLNAKRRVPCCLRLSSLSLNCISPLLFHTAVANTLFFNMQLLKLIQKYIRTLNMSGVTAVLLGLHQDIKH
jgi:hypothetical protein